MWYVYVLHCADGHLYTGFTTNVEDRLKRHMAGYVPSTKLRLPVSLVAYFAFIQEHRALSFEKYLKSGSGRAFLSRHFL